MRLTFSGASSSLWTPAICSLSGKCSLRSYCGGLRGSGKFEHTNGSESSRYCTRHVIVAMAYPWSQSLKVKLAFQRSFLFVTRSHQKKGKGQRPTTRRCQHWLIWNWGCTSQIKVQGGDVTRKQTERTLVSHTTGNTAAHSRHVIPHTIIGAIRTYFKMRLNCVCYIGHALPW